MAETSKNEIRQQELHDQEMKESQQRLKQRAETHEARMAMFGSIASLMPTVLKLTDIYCTQTKFGKDDAIRAAACSMFQKAAESEGTPEALEECADRLLDISETYHNPFVRKVAKMKFAKKKAG